MQCILRARRDPAKAQPRGLWASAGLYRMLWPDILRSSFGAGSHFLCSNTRASGTRNSLFAIRRPLWCFTRVRKGAANTCTASNVAFG